MEVSSAIRSKSKDKMAMKELPKSFSKPSFHPKTSGKIPSSGYDPHLGTFHMFEAPKEFQMYGRFMNIDDMENPDGDSFKTIEDDSACNNGICSGETLPGADNDKREKSRRKNERKHQRQRERRAQELHERCSSYLVSRKLEALSQELVNMGFSHEQATVALILNEGRIEESVSWILKACEEDKSVDPNVDGGCNFKLDISEALMRIADMETKYKATKQEIEKIVITYEGDLDKVEDILKGHSMEPSIISPKRENRSDPPATLRPSIDPKLKSSQEPKSMQLKLEWARTKAETLPPLADGNEMKNSQRAQSLNQLVPNSMFSSSSPGPAVVRCSNDIDAVRAHKLVPPVDISRSLGLNGFSSSSTNTQMIKTAGNKSPFEYLSVTHNWDRRSSISSFDYKSVDWSSGLESLIAEFNGDSYGLFPYNLGPKKSSFREWSSPFEERDLFSLHRLLLCSSSL